MRLFRPRQFPRETEDPDYRHTNKKVPRIAEALTTVETARHSYYTKLLSRM